MSEKRSNYDQNGNYTGYSVEEDSVPLGFIDFTNMPAIDTDDAIGMWLWCLLIDFVSFIISLGILSPGMLRVGTCLISIVVLLIMIAMVISYLIKPMKTGEKWVADSILALVVLLFYLAIHIIVITCL